MKKTNIVAMMVLVGSLVFVFSAQAIVSVTSDNKKMIDNIDPYEIKDTNVHPVIAPARNIYPREIKNRFEREDLLPIDSENIVIKNETKILNDKMILVDGKNEMVVANEPSMVYAKLSNAFKKYQINIVDQVSLAVKDGTPKYSLQISEPVRFFGLIPGKIYSSVEVLADNLASVKVVRPWYVFLTTYNKQWVDDIKLLPNLVMTNIEFYPTKFKAGEKVVVTANIKNDGLGFASGGPNLYEGSGPGADFFVNDRQLQWYYISVGLNPGEIQPFSFTWDKVVCGTAVKVAVANGGYIEETNKDDNSMTIKAICK